MQMRIWMAKEGERSSRMRRARARARVGRVGRSWVVAPISGLSPRGAAAQPVSSTQVELFSWVDVRKLRWTGSSSERRDGEGGEGVPNRYREDLQRPRRKRRRIWENWSNF